MRRYGKQSFTDKCEKQGLDYKKVYNYIYRYKKRHTDDEKSDEEFIDMYKNRETRKPREKIKKLTVKNLCDKYNVSIHKVRYLKRYNKDITTQQAIDIVLNKENAPDSIYKICKNNNVPYDVYLYYKKKYPDKSINELMQICSNRGHRNRNDIIAKTCEENNIPTARVRTYLYRNRDKTLDEAINHYKNYYYKSKSKDETLYGLCKKFGISTKTAYSYSKRHPELINIDIIKHYKPNLYENVLGELVELDELIKK